MKFTETNRGFAVTVFKDLYGVQCSLQKSSLATDDVIWFGCDEGTHHQGQCMARMHLNQKQVAALLPALQHFVDTGELPKE
jgi:hypothetical protein